MSMLLFLLKVLSWVFERFWLHLWPVLMQAINHFPIHEKIKQFWHHRIYKHQNVTSTLVFTIVFEIHRTFSLFYLFDWKFTDLIIFFFVMQNVCAQKIAKVSEVLRTQAHLISIRCTICPALKCNYKSIV